MTLSLLNVAFVSSFREPNPVKDFKLVTKKRFHKHFRCTISSGNCQSCGNWSCNVQYVPNK